MGGSVEFILWSIDQALSELGRAVFFLYVPPWLAFIAVWIRDKEKHLVLWTAGLGAVGAVLADLILPGIYLWADSLAAIGLVGLPAATLSGVVYGAGIGLPVWILIRVVRRLGREHVYR